ncbi:MarR family transcriptional regulator [Streptomyces sp. NPDC002992]|uniref:MarR family transcriptional regulator n=1 Tax=Streptomyces sp. NPDC002992 TaxID=3154273 RepID=UPI0033BADC8F
MLITTPLPEDALSKPMLRSLRVTSPLLFVVGAMNAVTAQIEGNRGALATALCLCVCAAGLFTEDLLQQDLRRDPRVLAYVAAHPNVSLARAAGDLDLPLQKVEVSLARLVAAGLLVHTGEEERVRTYSTRA